MRSPSFRSFGLATGMVAEHGNDDPAILRSQPGNG